MNKKIRSRVLISLLALLLAGTGIGLINRPTAARADTVAVTTWSDTFTLGSTTKEKNAVHNGLLYDRMSGSSSTPARTYAKFRVTGIPTGATNITASLVLRSLENAPSAV